jgi:hypothetical protein
MPQLVEYNAPEGLGLRPSEVGIEATAGAARRVNAAYNEAAGVTMAAGHMLGSAIQAAGDAAVNYLDHAQISQGAAAFAGLTAKATADWNNRNKVSDPNNQSIGQDWLQNVLEPQLAAFKGGFITQKGQDWAEANVEKLRNHFTTKVTADMSRKAGEAVSSNHAQALNSWSTAVYNDPSLLDEALGLTKQHTSDLVNSSGVADKPSAITQLTQKNREMLINSAARGYVSKHAEMPPWIDPGNPAYRKDYAGFVNAAELDRFKREVRQNQNAIRLQEKQLQDYQKKQDTDAVNAAVDDNRNNNTSFDATSNRYTIKPEFFDNANKIRQMPQGEKAGQAMLEWGQRQQDKRPPPVRDNSEVHADLLERMVTPTDRPTTEIEIRLAAAKDEITPATTHKLIALNNALTKAPIRDPVMQASLAAIKPLLGTDTVGKQNYSAFLQDFTQQYLQLPTNQRAGALDFKNSNSLINQVMAPYNRTPQQKMEQHINDRLGITPTPGPTSAPGTPVAVKTMKEAQDLQPGTLYVTPDGQRFTR